MKYLKLFESFEDRIHEICRKYKIGNYTINPDGTINGGSINIWNNYKFKKIPLKFNVTNSFDCSGNYLTSLEGSPVEVNGDFRCEDNELKSFKGSPKIIRGQFNCRYNDIKTFEYFPNYIKDSFKCEGNPIWQVWRLFQDITKIELLNDFDMFRDEDTDAPGIVMDRLDDFLLTIGKKEVDRVGENFYYFSHNYKIL